MYGNCRRIKRFYMLVVVLFNKRTNVQDVPSIDALDSKEVAAHHALYLNGVHIVENLLLQSIPPGLYEFIGLPLKIVGADGAPLRAVLRRK